MKNIGLRIWKDIFKYKWFIIGFLAYYVISHNVWGAYCPMLLITGLPCPGCGMSRAIFFVFTFQFSRAWMMNPIAFLWAILIIIFLVYRYLLGKNVKFLKTPLILVLIFTIVYYMYRMLALFPAYPPIVYRRNNLLGNLIPFYEDFIMRLFETI